MGAIHGIVNSLFGLANPQKRPKNYDDPKYMADSWKWVQAQNKKGLMGDMPKQEQASPYRQGVLSPEQEKTKAAYKDKRTQHNSGLQRWKRQINNMMASQNPNLQAKAQKMIGAYRAPAGEGRGRTLFQVGGDRDGFSQTAYLDDNDQLVKVGKPKQTMAQTGSLQELNYINGIKDPERQEQEMLRLFPDYLDAGTYWQHKTTGHQIPKNLAKKEEEVIRGKSEGEFINSYTENAVQREIADYRLEETIDAVDELMGATGYDSVGLASWTGWIPSSSAGDWQAMADTIESRIGLDAIAEMKSKGNGSTGMGAMNIAELKMIQEKLGSLRSSQSKPSAKRAIAGIRKSLMEMRARIGREQTRKAKKYDSLYPEYSGKKGNQFDTSRYLQEPSPESSASRNSSQKTWEDGEYFYRKMPDGTTQRSKK